MSHVEEDARFGGRQVGDKLQATMYKAKLENHFQRQVLLIPTCIYDEGE